MHATSGIVRPEVMKSRLYSLRTAILSAFLFLAAGACQNFSRKPGKPDSATPADAGEDAAADSQHGGQTSTGGGTANGSNGANGGSSGGSGGVGGADSAVALGLPCASGKECASTFCVDGVCCESAC